MLHYIDIVLCGASVRTQSYERLTMTKDVVDVKLQRMFTFDESSPARMQLWVSSYVSEALMKRIHHLCFISSVRWSQDEAYDLQSIIITLRTPMYDEAEQLVVTVIKEWYEEECGAERRFRPLHISLTNPIHPVEHFQPHPLSRPARLGRVRAKMSWALAEEKYELLFLLSGEEKRLKKTTSRR
jgi:hypothetical protein